MSNSFSPFWLPRPYMSMEKIVRLPGKTAGHFASVCEAGRGGLADAGNDAKQSAAASALFVSPSAALFLREKSKQAHSFA